MFVDNGSSLTGEHSHETAEEKPVLRRVALSKWRADCEPGPMYICLKEKNVENMSRGPGSGINHL